MSDKDQIKDRKIIQTALEDQNNIKPNKIHHFYARHYILHQTDFIKILTLALKSVVPSQPPPTQPPPLPTTTTIIKTTTKVYD